MRAKSNHVLQIIVIIGAPFALAFGLPMSAAPSSVNSIFNSLVLFSFLLGFYLNRALERRKQVTNSVEVELARLRRIWNIAHSLDDPQFREKISPALREFHQAVGADLPKYKNTLETYRVVSEMVYRYAPATRRDEQLWGDLLTTTREIALERRPLERALETRLTRRAWAVFGFIGLSVVALLLLNRGHDGLTRLSVALTVAGIFAAIDLLYRTDRMSQVEIERLQNLYLHNLPQADELFAQRTSLTR